MHYIVFKVRIVFVYNNCHKMFNWLLWNVSPYASTFFFAEDSVSKNTIRFIPVLIYDYANFCWKDCRYISIFALPLKGESKFFSNFYASGEIWLDRNHFTLHSGQKCLGGWFLAGNQGNHQNFENSLLTNKLWRVLVRIK